MRHVTAHDMGLFEDRIIRDINRGTSRHLTERRKVEVNPEFIGRNVTLRLPEGHVLNGKQGRVVDIRPADGSYKVLAKGMEIWVGVHELGAPSLTIAKIA